VALLATSPHPPLVVASTASVGDLTVAESPVLEEPTSEAWEVPALVTLGADGVSQGIVCVKVDGAGPRLSHDVGSLLWGLVKCCASINVPGNATPGDVAPAPRSLGTTSSGVSRLHLPSPLGFCPHLLTGGG
jgi:hypothetical protein